MPADEPLSAAEPQPPLHELTYHELRRLAAGHLARERPDHTLQPTALVNEAYLRLRDVDGFTDREHFLATASRAMRRILVDHARSHDAEKRGGGADRLELDEVVDLFESRSISLVALSDALEALEEMDEQLVRIVELRFFGGMTEDEVATTLGVSRRTVTRGWVVARNWLRERL